MKKFGIFSLTALVVSNMIGAGVFTTSGFAIADLGDPRLVIWAWIVGGVIALSGALSYSALVKIIPESGGEYLFLSRTIHPLVGFLGGWVSFLAGFTGAIAYAAITFESYFFPDFFSKILPENVIAVAAICLAIIFHGFRVQTGIVFQNLIVGLKLFFIAVFVIWAFSFSDVDSWGGFQFISKQVISGSDVSFSVFAMTVVWISYSYAGFNSAIYVADEVKNPGKTIPRGLILGTLLTFGIYLLLNSIFVLALDPSQIAGKQNIATLVAHMIGGNSLATFCNIIISLALFTSISGMIIAGPRVYSKMAEDKLLPESFNIKKYGPKNSILAQGAFSILLVLIGTLLQLLTYISLTLSLSTLVAICCLFILARRKQIQTKELWGYPWIPLFFVLSTILMMLMSAFHNPWGILSAAITILSGALVYYIIIRYR